MVWACTSLARSNSSYNTTSCLSNFQKRNKAVQVVILPLLPIFNLVILSLIAYLIRLIDGSLFLFLIDGYLFDH